MNDQAGTLEHLALMLARVLSGIGRRLDDQAVQDTFEELGVLFPDALLADATITAARRTVIGTAAGLDAPEQALNAAIAAGDDDGTLTAGLALLTQCGRVIAAFPELAAALTSAGPGLPGITAAQIAALVDGLPGRLTDLLLADLLQVTRGPAAVLEVFGILERTFQPGDPANPAAPPHEAVAVHLDRLPRAVSDPVGALADRYGWGTPAFDPAALFTVVESVVAGLLLPVLFTPGTATAPPTLQAYTVTVEPTADGTGLALDLALPVGGQNSADVTLSPPTWSAHVSVSGEVPGETAAEIRPPGQLSLTGDLTAEADVGVTARTTDPFVLLGITGGTRLEFTGATADAGVRLTFDPATGTTRAEPTADGEISGGKVVIDASAGDGFVATLLGGQRLESDFTVGFTFAPGTGLRFHGSDGLEIRIPAHVELGPVGIDGLYLRATPGDTTEVEVSAAFTAAFGPVRATVDRIGAVAELTFPDGGGNLGPARLTAGFKPPTGAGLTVDAGVVTGGGFLTFDPAHGQYAGALDLELAGFLAVRAVGLVTTGQGGFSLLVVLTAEFGDGGLQLGFGFRLLAVGGIIGLDRGMSLPAITEGVRTGAIESVMFPRDVIANAPRILSDLAAFFPQQPGTLLIGPMVKIGWGTPTLLSASVAIVVEVPGDIAVLGVLKVTLPAEDDPLLLLQADFAGGVEFDKKLVHFFASLFGSRVLGITIQGQMGVLVAYGDQPELVVTVGGFNPAFKPPPLPFPVPDRVVLSLVDSGSARVTATGYFAVTSNTAQFGADLDLFFGFSDFSLVGHGGFDALFQFSPFQFSGHANAHASVKVFGVGLFGVSLDFTLTGPTPWRASGTASISLLFFSIGIDVDVSWGEQRDMTLPPVEVLDVLAAELSKPESWRTVPPAAGSPLVGLRQQAPGADEIVLHPFGGLVVSQRAVPLDITLDRVGEQRADDVSRCSVSPGAGLAKTADATEMFALGQFQNLGDTDRLSRPAFERQHSGLALGSDGAALASSRAVRRSTRYEQIVLDPIARDSTHLADYNPALYEHFLGGSSASRSPLAQAERLLRQPFADGVTVAVDPYAVASTRDNTAAAPVFAGEAQARTHLDALLAENPALAGTLHVIPATEVAA